MDSKKMREYKYIRNTLPDNVSREGSIEGLGIGKKVENLLPELSEENIGEEKSWKIIDANLGTLATTVDLKPNTNYSIQVMNRSVKDGQEYNPSTTLPSTFFQTGPQKISQTITISGLTPYFNLENSRYWKSNIKPSVYLFETDNAWLIDRDGVIFGQSLEPFVYLDDVSETTLPIEYTDEYIKKVFKTITYENNEKQNELKFTVSEEMKKIVESGEWIYLATYRDRLTSDAQVTWNKQKFLARYGRIGQISNGSRNQRFYVKNDKFKADVLKSNYFSVNIKDKELKGDIVISFFPEDSATANEFNLALGSTLGYNKKYAQSYGQDMAQRFTSICFAWVRKKGGVYERISDYSRPVIIDRQLSNGWSIENNEWVFNNKFDNQTVKVCEYSGLDNDLKGYGYSDGLYIILKQNINQ